MFLLWCVVRLEDVVSFKRIILETEGFLKFRIIIVVICSPALLRRRWVLISYSSFIFSVISSIQKDSSQICFK
jgi:hypothetical protein